MAAILTPVRKLPSAETPFCRNRNWQNVSEELDTITFVQTYQKRKEVPYMEMSRDNNQKRKKSPSEKVSRDTGEYKSSESELSNHC